jgi:hypothetical protein
MKYELKFMKLVYLGLNLSSFFYTTKGASGQGTGVVCGWPQFEPLANMWSRVVRI